MKKILTMVVLFFLWAAWMEAEDTQLNWSGRLKLFGSLFVSSNQDGTFFHHGSGEFAFKRLEARLKLAGDLNERISFKLRFDCFSNPGELILYNQFPNADFLGIPVTSEYFGMTLYEASVRISDFLVKKLDLTVGKQRIQWGTADKVNVVDNLNPIDFANFFTFDPDYFAERRPQTALNFEYYLTEQTKIQLVWLIQHQVSPMPFGYPFEAKNFITFSRSFVQVPWKERLDQTNWGIRLSGGLFGIDAAISLYHGNSSIPVVYGVSTLPILDGYFTYPWMNIVGLDLAGEVAGIGWWAEAGIFMPKTVDAFVRVPALYDGIGQMVKNHFSLFEKVYVKYVLGGDYNFGRGFYINLQYLHGFFDEFDYSQAAQLNLNLKKGMFFGELADYLLGRLEYKNQRQTAQVKLGTLVEFASGQNSISLIPELEFRVGDGLIIQSGGFFLLSGKPDQTKFGMFRNDKIFYMGLKVDF